MVLYGKKKELSVGGLILLGEGDTEQIVFAIFLEITMNKKFKKINTVGEIQRAIIHGTKSDYSVYYDSTTKGIQKRIKKHYRTLNGAINCLTRIGFIEIPKRAKGQYQLELRIEAIERIRKWLVSRHKFIKLERIINSSKISKPTVLKWMKNGKIEISDNQYKALRECVDFIKGINKVNGSTRGIA